MTNPLIEAWDNHPNKIYMMLDLMELLEERQINFCGIKLTKGNLMRIRRELMKNGIAL